MEAGTGRTRGTEGVRVVDRTSGRGGVHRGRNAGRAWTGRPAWAVGAARMRAMYATPALRPPGFSRPSLLGASASGLALLVTGCTSSPADCRKSVTSEQADELAA